MTDVATILEEYLADVRAGGAGSAADAEQLIAKHPSVAGELRAALGSLEFIRRMEIGIRPEESGPPGGELGDFHILRELGRGGMGVVYEAEQISLRRRVALKVLPFAGVMDPKHLQRFRNEAQAAAQLHHTNIVPVHAVGCERGVHYYAMQYIEGETLALAITQLKGGGRGGSSSPISSHSSHRERDYLRAAATLAMQAAEALDHAHQMGVVHRDIKPSNLMVDVSGNLWITDFGLARVRGDTALTVSGDLVGTLKYMSPEQAAAQHSLVDHRTDIYSLGATFYELVTLECAVKGEDAQTVLKEIADRDPPGPRKINPAVPLELETILLKAMRKDPSGRYLTAKEMAEDLRRFLADQPIRARPPTLLDHARKWARRHAPVVAGACVALLLLVAGLLASTLLIARQRDRADGNFAASERSRVESEASLVVAREAIDEMLIKVGDTKLQSIPLMEGVRRDLFEKAHALFKSLLARQREDPRLRFDVARLQSRLGDLKASLGEYEAAETDLEEASATLDSLVAELPEQVDYRARLADTAYTLAGVFVATGRRERAEEQYRKALAHGERLVEALPTDPRRLIPLAMTEDGLAALLGAEGKGDESNEAFGRARDYCEKSLALSPADPDVRFLKIQILNNFGAHLMNERRFPEVAENFVAVLVLAEGLLSETPHDRTYRNLAATAHHNLGVALARLDRRAEALVEVRQGIELWEGLVRDFPSTPEHAQRLAGGHRFMANLLRHAGARGEADLHARLSLEISEQIVAELRELPGNQEMLAVEHARFARELEQEGLHEEAAEHFRKASLARRKLFESDVGPASRDRLRDALDWEGRKLHSLQRFEEGERAFADALAASETPGLESNADAVVGRAGTRINRGNLLVDAGRTREAADAYRAGIVELRSVADQFPAGATCHEYLAIGCKGLAWLLRSDGPTEERVALLREGATRFASVARADPDNYVHTGRCIDCFKNLLDCYEAMKRPQDAAELNRELVMLLAELVAKAPGELRYAFDLAFGWRLLGRELARRNEAKEAEEAFRNAVQFGGRAARGTGDPGQRAWLANCLNELGEFLLQQDRDSEAEEAFRESLTLRLELKATDAASHDHESEIGGTLHNLANALSNQGGTDQVTELYERAIGHQLAALASSPGNPHHVAYLGLHYRMLATHLLGLESYDRAAKVAHALSECGNFHLEAGRLLLRCAEAAEGDKDLARAEGARLADAYADLALGEARKAAEAAPESEEAKQFLAYVTELIARPR